jgi:membrane protease YdiL (CAAX protease family)
VMCVAAAILRHRNRMSRAYTASRLRDGTFVEAFALYLVSMIGIGTLLRFFGFERLAWNWLLLLLVPLLLLWMARRTGSVQQILHAAGLHRGRGWCREMGAGLVGYVAGLAVIVPGFLIAYLLIRTSGAATGHPIMTPLLTGDRWQILGFYGIACIVAPLTEETMFRGILFHHLRARWSWAISSVLISLLFAIIHPQGWAAVPALGAIALVLAAIREWRGSLIASISAHAFNNFLSLTCALLLLKGPQ